MRRAALGGLAALLAVAGAVLPAGRASAHAALEDTSPRASSVLEEPPTQIVLDFDEDVEINLGGIVLLDEQGNQLKLSSPTHGGDATQVLADVADPSSMGAGVYVVVYRVLSADSHPVAGSFSFQIGTGAGDQQSVLDRVTRGVGGTGNDSTVAWLLGVARFLSFAGTVIVLGGWMIAAMRPAAEPVGPRTARLLWTGLAVAGVGTLGTFLLQGPRAAGGTVGDAFDTTLWRDIAETKYGKALLIRLILLALAVVPMLGVRISHHRQWRLSAVVVGASLLVTYGIAGHPGAFRLAAFGVLLDMVHLSAVSLWLGGLIVLAVAGREWLTDADDGQDEDRPAVRTPIWRFSRLATICVPVVVATGLLQTWRIMKHADAISGSTYGRTLVAKVTVAGLLIVLGGMARSALRRFGPSSLRATVVAEAVIGMTVLGITAGLVAVPPAVVRPVVPAVATASQNGLSATLTITPARVGGNDLHVTVTQPAAATEPTLAVTVRLSLADRGIEPQNVALVGEGPDHYSAYDIAIVYSGTWTVDIVVQTADGSTVLLQTTATIAGRSG